MPELHNIENALKKTGWNLARIKLLARFLVALIVCRSVCLTKIANALAGDAQTASSYKRLQRFLSGFDLDAIAIAPMTLGWMESAFWLKPPYVLSMDGDQQKAGGVYFATIAMGMCYPHFLF